MIERRFYVTELRAESQGDEMALTGYASTFGNQSHDLGGFRETVMPGAFARSLREGNDVKALINHDPSKLLGRTKNKTLTLEEDGKGLKFRVALPDTQDARDLHTLVKRGDMDACSFAFVPREQSWEDARSENGDLYANRKLMDVDLRDISIVTDPAYPKTSVNARFLFPEGEPVEVRSHVEAVKEQRDKKADTKKFESADTSADHDAAASYHNEQAAATGMYEKSEGRAHLAAANMHSASTRAAKKANAMTKAINSGNADVVDPEFNYRAKEKRGSEAQIPEPYAINLPGPFDSDMKQAWWDAFMAAYAVEVHEKKNRYQEAIGNAIAVANQKVKVDTETPAEISGQEKNPTLIKGDIVDTGARSQEEIDAEKRKESVSSQDPKCECRCANCVDGRCADCTAETRCPMGVRSKEQRDRVDDVSDPDSPDYDPDDPDFDPEWDGEDDSEDRAAKTKKKGGKNLTAADFAFVGDPNDTSTWKLPIHDEAHAKNALARENQTEGIPADKKADVHAKIVAAAKKFGIEVAEEKSKDDENILQAMRDRMRLIEIDLE